MTSCSTCYENSVFPPYSAEAYILVEDPHNTMSLTSRAQPENSSVQFHLITLCEPAMLSLFVTK